MKNINNYLLYAAIIIVLAALIFSVVSFLGFQNQKSYLCAQNYCALNSNTGKASFTPFDTKLAKKFMDKDNDGKCDVCGMLVEQCIETGQLQCNMAGESAIGLLGSAHMHADFKVFINGKAIDFAKPEYYMKSSFIHLDYTPNKEDAGGVLHMHASGVPLWIFFESIGGKFGENCLAVSSAQTFCNDAKNNVKFYVNGKPNREFGNYVFKSLDKILISYGDVNEGIQKQLERITDFAKGH